MKAAWPILLLLPLAGCLGGDAEVGPHDGSGTIVPGQHPYPLGDGSEWPIIDGAPLTGPFPLRSITRHQVASHDGTLIDGWVVMPDVPGDPPLPVALTISPYWGGVGWHPESPGFLEACCANNPVGSLMEAGYAVAIFNVRGSGGSGGCMTFLGPDEQDDHPYVIEWLAEQEWSNGRVGMVGYSYDGGTQWASAVRSPPALKTIVSGGILADMYARIATPQGAPWFYGAAADVGIGVVLSYGQSTAVYGADDIDRLVPASVRPCPGFVNADRVGFWTTGDRDGAWLEDRRVTNDIRNITAAVWIVQGLQDGLMWQSGHLWPFLDHVPRRATTGQWGHVMPDDSMLATHPDGQIGGATWPEMLVAWYDYWLKGIGEAPPGVGVVDHESRFGTWHRSDAWPPSDAVNEVLWLAAGGLGAAPGSGTPSFVGIPEAGPSPANDLGLPGLHMQAVCHPAPVSIHYELAVAEDVTMAGNPYAMLGVESDQPGGIVSVELYHVPADMDCASPLGPAPTLIAHGAIDLQYDNETYVPVDFPTDTARTLRVDFPNISHTLPAGDRLHVIIHQGGIGYHWGLAHAPQITIHEDSSRLMMPIIEGTLGGARDAAIGDDDPPRPWLPPA